MSESVTLSLFDSLGQVPDPRLERTRLHQLVDILVIAVCATICAAETWEEIAEFGHAKEGWFRKFLALPNGIPSHDTFRRVFLRINPKKFQESFLLWMRSVAEVGTGEVVAIDGKAVRGARSPAGKEGLRMVSAWAAEQRLVLGQLKTAEKSNEITAIAHYRVLRAFNGLEALDVAKRERPDLVISDVAMPHADGLELCRAVRADADLSATPIMLVSAMRKDTESAVEGLRAGAEEYLEGSLQPDAFDRAGVASRRAQALRGSAARDERDAADAHQRLAARNRRPRRGEPRRLMEPGSRAHLRLERARGAGPRRPLPIRRDTRKDAPAHRARLQGRAPHRLRDDAA